MKKTFFGVLLLFVLFSCTRSNITPNPAPPDPPPPQISSDSMFVNLSSTYGNGTLMDSFSVGSQMYYLPAPVGLNGGASIKILKGSNETVTVYLWLASKNVTVAIAGNTGQNEYGRLHFLSFTQHKDSAVFNNIPVDSLSDILLFGNF